jgi:hypothetical protein
LVLKARLVKPTLKDYVMVPDKHGPSWVRAKDLLSYYRSAVGEVKTDFPDYLTLQEERISDEEQDLLELWANKKQEVPETKVDNVVSESTKMPNSLLHQIKEIQTPHRLYADYDHKELMEEMELSITRRRGGNINPPP